MAPDPRLKDLLMVAEAAEAREMTRLSELSAKIRSLQAKIQALRAPGDAPADSAFARAGLDSRYAQWRTQEITRLNAALAGHMAERENQKKSTSRALGRRLVVEKLLTQDLP